MIDWIKENDFKRIIVHWELDMLSPEAFRSLLCNEPLTGPVPYAVGSMYIQEIAQLLCDINQAAESVGLGICEYMPWDAINLRKTMEGISIFRECFFLYIE